MPLLDLPAASASRSPFDFARLVLYLRVSIMARKPKAYVAALPLAAVPELQELLSRFCGGDAPRGHVVMARLGDAALAALDQLVEAGLFGSRSEAAAFLLGAGIEAQRELFARVGKHSIEIRRLRQSLKQDALEALRGTAAKPRDPRSSRKRSDD
jgi:Arc/MetJ-type ribon-helix-helix transcriptional regulator